MPRGGPVIDPEEPDRPYVPPSEPETEPEPPETRRRRPKGGPTLPDDYDTPTSYPSPEPPSPDIYQEDVSLKPGDWVNVTWERPGGGLVNVGVRADRVSKFQENILHEGGRIVTASTVDGKTFYKSPTTSQYQQDIKNYYQQYYQEYGVVPHSIYSKVEVPDEIKQMDLEREYRDISYQVSLGIISESEANRQLKELASKRVDVDYMQQYGEFGTYPIHKRYDKEGVGVIGEHPRSGEPVVWGDIKKLEPAAELRKTGPFKFETFLDVKKWQKEQDDLFGDVFGTVFMPIGERVDYAAETIWGEDYAYRTPFESKKMKEIRATSQYQYSQSDILGKVGRFVGSPLVLFPLTYGISFGMGAGVGAFKATSLGSKELVKVLGKSVTPGMLSEVGIAGGFGGYAAFESAPVVKSGDPFSIGKHFGIMGLTGAFGLKGYSRGHSFGYGRIESYLYGKHTYKPGSKEYVRFVEALKVSRKLYNVRSDYAKPLDLAKDIMRMDARTAKQFLNYYRSHKGVIGGSAASYTQIVGARPPRDIDYFLQRWLFGTDKKVLLAKKILPTKTKTGQHLIDIHGKDMYYPGKYYRFGFVSKKPVRIGEFKFFRAAEQLFRKGEASVALEKRFRHGTYPGFSSKGTMKAPKDIFDFVVHAKSLIGSASRSWNPLTRLKGISASKHLDMYLNPSKSDLFGKVTSFDSWIVKHIKPAPSPKPVSIGGGMVDYSYPPSMYPSKYPGIGAGAYGYTIFPKGYSPMVKLDYKVKADVSPGGYDKIFDGLKIVSPLVGIKPTKSKGIISKVEISSQKNYPTNVRSNVIPLVISRRKQPEYEPKSYKSRYPFINRTQIDNLGKGAEGGQRDLGQAFIVMVKSRQYVHGKAKGREKFRPLTSKPFVYTDGMSVGGAAIDNSIAQQFYLKPTSKKAKPLRKALPSRWDSIYFKFEAKKGKWMERRGHAIDTRGEVDELDVYNWWRSRPVKKKQSGSALPSFGMDMYGFDKMQGKMDRMFRRMM